MSSAALQTAPHQPANIPSLGSQQSANTASPSTRPYPSQQSRDPYYNQQPSSNNASPTSTSTRRPSRRPSGNGASSNNSQQPQYYSPTGSSQNTAPITSRMANPVSPTSNAASPTSNSQADRARGAPPVAPPRTSSNQRVASAPKVDIAAMSAIVRDHNASLSRVAATDDGQDREVANGHSPGAGSERDRLRGDAAAATNTASRSRRRAEQEQLPYRSSSNQNTQNPPSRSRQANSTISPPGPPTREPSEVINRLVVSSPDVDVERERVRLAEAVPPGGNDAAVGGPEIKEEAPRRRQDHSASKREKTSKFGDYFLGNTLGEGEFGKVKMGWKQTGGPDVSHISSCPQILLNTLSGCY